ncbi:MAG: hypothetical protein A2138_19405 [Deltaproteobacteria bacterium RBG_16_71_12]|nr:MAG: hypothetical protein A2138_19405 [Deltaproteobacteria bacterium RBG_16_71_12]
MPEIVARNVSAFTLTYFDGANTAMATLPLNTAADKLAVRRIDYVVTFQTTVNGRQLNHSVAGAVRLQNL